MPPLSFGTNTGKNVLVADFLDQVDVELPVLGGHAQLTLAQAWNESELAPFLADTDVMILFHDIARISDATLAAAPRLKAIVRAGVGYNNVDIEAAGMRGIVTCNVPDYGSEEVADHSIMFLLAWPASLVHAISQSEMANGITKWPTPHHASAAKPWALSAVAGSVPPQP